MTGRINSFQSFGTVDGPGIRYVLFMQGCHLRCACCHNPETWGIMGGKEYSASEIIDRAFRYKNYYSNKGGVTVSGGEPLNQKEFVAELFKGLKAHGIHTCLDTSGYSRDNDYSEILKYTDLVLLDIKYPTDELYKKYVGCSINYPLSFLKELQKFGIKTWIRQVVIPTLNDNAQSIAFLNDLKKDYSVIEKIELLPFRKLCIEKYKSLSKEFPLEGTPEASKEIMDKLNAMLV